MCIRDRSESVDISSGRSLRCSGMDFHVHCLYSAGEYVYRRRPGKILPAVSVFGMAGSKSFLRAGEAEKFSILSAGAGSGRRGVLCCLCGGRAVLSLIHI